MASMWNTYRQCQLHLIDLLVRLNRLLSKDPEAYNRSKAYRKACSESQNLVDDVCASMAFMFVGVRMVGNKPRGPIWQQKQPPMLIGGLSLQWVLFTVSILDIVPATVRHSMRDSLLWIGRNLGIGQATMLAKVGKKYSM